MNYSPSSRRPKAAQANPCNIPFAQRTPVSIFSVCLIGLVLINHLCQTVACLFVFVKLIVCFFVVVKGYYHVIHMDIEFIDTNCQPIPAQKDFTFRSN